jgi:hypothetical protein
VERNVFGGLLEMGIDAVMFVRYVGDPPTQEQLDNWNKDLDYKIEIRSFGIEKSPISIKNDELWDDRYYNNELIETNDGYTVLDMNVSARYFSKSYPRGNILYLCSVAEWIEYNFKDFSFEILYGSDSNYNYILFDEERRKELKNYFYSCEDL